MKNLLKSVAIVSFIISAHYAYAEEITKPHTFTADTDAKAEEVNANFDLLYKKMNEVLGIVRPTSSSAAEALLRTITTPENVTISPNGSGQATVTWNAVKGASSYNLYLATESGVNASNYTTKANGQMITGVTSPYTVTKLTNGTQYFFSLAAVTPIGESVASLEVKTVPSAIPTEGLVAYYPFNGNANDESGNGNHGTVNGATLTTDRNNNVNSAYSFNGNSNYISIKGDQFNFSDEASFSLWVSPEKSQQQHAVLLDKSHSSTGVASWVIQQTGTASNSYYFGWGDGTAWSDTSDKGFRVGVDINPLAWTHLAISKKGTTAKYYLNGVFVSSITSTNSPVIVTNGNKNLNIGAWFNGSRFFNGKIDDIRIYKRSLTESEIQQLYKN